MQCSARMQVYTEASLWVRDAVEELEHACESIYAWWWKQRDRKGVHALDAVIESGLELAAALAAHHRTHDRVIANGVQLYSELIATLRVLQQEQLAPRSAIRRARTACIRLLDVAGELGHP